MSEERIMLWIADEIRRAEKKHPGWPDDLVHAAAVVAEESGELVKACLEHTYEREKSVLKMDIAREAVHTAAMAIRFLKNLGEF